jgi:tripartite ATP-independent transporter DctM subunit
MISGLIIALFLFFMLAGVPVCIALGLSTVISMLVGGYDLIVLPQRMAASIQSIELMAIPFFVLAANLMNALGITRDIFNFANSLVGSFRGGLAQANVIASIIFSGISGSAIADAAALGSISMTEMPKVGYTRPFSAAVVIASSTIGPLVPPSIMMIIYSVTAEVSVARLFLAGLIPALLVALALMITLYVLARTGHAQCPAPTPFSFPNVLTAGRKAFFALLAPLVIFRGMATGLTTVAEAGVIAVLYALVLGAIQRRIRLGALISAVRDSVETSALIMYIIAVSSAISWVVVHEGTAKALATFVTGYGTSPLLFFIVANLFLIVIGAVIETVPALLIAVPILLPTALALGIDPIQFGVVVIFNLVVSIMTPPIGIGLYLLIAISKVKFGDLVWATIPFHIVLFSILILLVVFPSLSLFLPHLLLP